MEYSIQVIISFPDPGSKNDVVSIRGPRQNVDKCYKHLKQMYDEMVSVDILP